MKYGCDGREAFSFKFYRFALAASSRSEVVFKWARPLTWPERPPINSGRRGPCSGSVHGILMGPFSRDGPLHDSTFDTITLNDLFFSFFLSRSDDGNNQRLSKSSLNSNPIGSDNFPLPALELKKAKANFLAIRRKNKQTNKQTHATKIRCPGKFPEGRNFQFCSNKKTSGGTTVFCCCCCCFLLFFLYFHRVAGNASASGGCLLFRARAAAAVKSA